MNNIQFKKTFSFELHSEIERKCQKMFFFKNIFMNLTNFFLVFVNTTMVVIATKTPILTKQEQKELEMNTSVEDHFAFFRSVYSKVFDYYLVQQVRCLL